MAHSDLPGVADVCHAAFGERFPMLLFETRLAADPTGCFVAGDGEGRVSAALISLSRGSMGWFGPLAVHPDAQRQGLGAELVGACLDAWRQREVGLMGLETLPTSSFHVQFYGGLGFRPSWTGISFRRTLMDAETAMPLDVHVDDIAVANPDFLYPEIDIGGEVRATTDCRAGHVLTTEDGVAIVHTEATFQPPDMGFVPFCAARNWDAFSRLMAAAEHVSREDGKTGLLTRASGSSWTTLDGLVDLGYRAGEVMVRMKAGVDADYDRAPIYYLDNWL